MHYSQRQVETGNAGYTLLVPRRALQSELCNILLQGLPYFAIAVSTTQTVETQVERSMIIC